MTRSKSLLAGVLFPAILFAVVYALFLPHPRSGGVTVSAEFENADKLVPGHDVLTRGTKIGVVDSIRLTDHGTALVKARLDRGVPAPRADASASVRVADLLGNVYLSLSAGQDPRPLTGTIPASRTFVATQLQDLLDSIDEPTRSALKAILVELGTALDARGQDLNVAVLRLAPLLDEVDRISRQVGSQNAQLGRLVTSGSALAAQLGPRSSDLERLIDGLDATLSITSGRAAELDDGVRLLPGTLRQTRRTLGRLRQVADATTPLAVDLAAVAPGLTSAVAQVRPFARTAGPALRRARLLTQTLTRTLSGGQRSLARLETGLTTLRTVAPPVRGFAAVLDPLIDFAAKGVLGGLGGLAAEPGPDGRNYFRGEVVLGCENFGVTTHPGCLTEVMTALQDRTTSKSSQPTRGNSPRPPRRPRPEVPATVAPVPRVPGLPDIGQLVPDSVKKALPGARPQTGEPSDAGAALLDFLLGP